MKKEDRNKSSFFFYIIRMKKNLSVKLALFVIVLGLTSCATIFSGTKDRIYFTTNIPGAKVLIDGIITRKVGDSQVEFKLEGYETRVINLSKSLNIVSILNFGNLLGWGIDIVTGAVFKYDRKAYDIELTKNNKVSKLNPEKIEIDTKKQTVLLYIREK
ncbi:MAG: hypothetical protein LW602_08760 [Sediminibacterium sp.]|nr:hypothetical protein [Sediminibacterium sp.]